MFLDVERYVDFIAKHKLTQAQFLMLYCLHKKEYDVIDAYKEAFPNEDGTMIGNILKQDLLTRGFIQTVGEGERADSYQVTELFTNMFVSDVHNAADEVWDIYPPFMKINGANVPLTNMDKYKFANLYGERIRYDVHEHKQVIADVKFGREHNLIRVNIENFVRSEMWKSIRKIRIDKEVIKEVKETEY